MSSKKKEKEKKKKKIGRPKIIIDYSNLDEKYPMYNLNKKNIWPISNVDIDYTLASPKKENCVIRFKSRSPETFFNIFSTVKGKHAFMCLNFSKNGIFMTYSPLIDNSADAVNVECFIFSKNLIEYQMKTSKNTKKYNFKVSIKDLFKMFKIIKAKTEFEFTIKRKKDVYTLKIMYYVGKKNTDTIKSHIYREKNSTFDSIDYSLTHKIISILNPELFLKKIQNIKSTEKTKCIIGYESDYLFIGTESESKIKYKAKIREGQDMKFIKNDIINKGEIRNMFIINSFFKFLSFKKTSKILKFYTSDEDLPSVMEYDLDPGLGVVQITIANIPVLIY